MPDTETDVDPREAVEQAQEANSVSQNDASATLGQIDSTMDRSAELFDNSGPASKDAPQPGIDAGEQVSGTTEASGDASTSPAVNAQESTVDNGGDVSATTDASGDASASPAVNAQEPTVDKGGDASATTNASSATSASPAVNAQKPTVDNGGDVSATTDASSATSASPAVNAQEPTVDNGGDASPTADASSATSTSTTVDAPPSAVDAGGKVSETTDTSSGTPAPPTQDAPQSAAGAASEMEETKAKLMEQTKSLADAEEVFDSTPFNNMVEEDEPVRDQAFKALEVNGTSEKMREVASDIDSKLKELAETKNSADQKKDFVTKADAEERVDKLKPLQDMLEKRADLDETLAKAKCDCLQADANVLAAKEFLLVSKLPLDSNPKLADAVKNFHEAANNIDPTSIAAQLSKPERDMLDQLQSSLTEMDGQYLRVNTEPLEKISAELNKAAENNTALNSPAALANAALDMAKELNQSGGLLGVAAKSFAGAVESEMKLLPGGPGEDVQKGIADLRKAVEGLNINIIGALNQGENKQLDEFMSAIRDYRGDTLRCARTCENLAKVTQSDPRLAEVDKVVRNAGDLIGMLPAHAGDAPGLNIRQARAAEKLLKKPLPTVSFGNRTLGDLWLKAVNRGRTELTEPNARDVFGKCRDRFWEEVFDNDAAKKMFLDMGCNFPKPGNAPTIKILDPASGEKVETKITFDHEEMLKDHWEMVLDAKNLRLTLRKENTNELRRLHNEDAFQKPPDAPPGSDPRKERAEIDVEQTLDGIKEESDLTSPPVSTSAVYFPVQDQRELERQKSAIRPKLNELLCNPKVAGQARTRLGEMMNAAYFNPAALKAAMIRVWFEATRGKGPLPF